MRGVIPTGEMRGQIEKGASRSFVAGVEIEAHEHLAAEYRQRPQGPHSPELARLLRAFRGQPVMGKLALELLPGPRWRIVRRTDRGEPLERVDDRVFDRREDAEWQVFRLRWKDIFGADLPEDLGTVQKGTK